MADADPESSNTSVDLKRISSSPLFNIPSFFGAKDSDSGRSPTSPLDFSVFGPRSPAPSSPQPNRWFCDKVGLSLLSPNEDSFTRDNIVLASQIKPHLLFDPFVKSNSLPKNYVVPSLSDAVNIHPLPSDSIADAWDTVVQGPRRSSTSPVDITSSQTYSRSLSAREMALSEDYTCIISHGPNPKTTHIFGDCILDCDPKEFGIIEKPEGNSLPDDSLSRLCLCTGEPQDCQNHIHKHSEAASAEKETNKGGLEDSLPGSSYKEDLFPMAINPVHSSEMRLPL